MHSSICGHGITDNVIRYTGQGDICNVTGHSNASQIIGYFVIIATQLIYHEIFLVNLVTWHVIRSKAILVMQLGIRNQAILPVFVVHYVR